MDREVARMTQKVLSLGWSGRQEERQVLGGKMRFCFCFWIYWIWDVWGPSKKRCLAGNWIYRYGTCKSPEQWHNTLTTAVIRGFTNSLTYIPSPISCAFCSILLPFYYSFLYACFWCVGLCSLKLLIWFLLVNHPTFWSAEATFLVVQCCSTFFSHQFSVILVEF